MGTSHDEQRPAQPPSQENLGTGFLKEGSCGGHTPAQLCRSQGQPPGLREELRGQVTASLCFPVPHLHPRWCSVVSQGELPSWTGATASTVTLPAAAAATGAPLQGQGARPLCPHRRAGSREGPCLCRVVQSFTQPRDPARALQTERAFPRKNRTGKTS